MLTNTDINQLNNLLHRLGEDVHKKQTLIIEKAEKGKKYLNILKTGKNIDVKEDEYNDLIFNLLHYRQYNWLTQKVFLEWNSDELLKHNGSFSEQAYISMGKLAKDEYDDFNEELFDITLSDLLFYKANGDESKIEALYDIYHKLMGREWIEAKFLKSLKTG